MPETMKLYSEYCGFEMKPSFDITKTGRKMAQDFMAFSAEFEKRVNDVLKDGWTLVNTTTSVLGAGVMVTAILKRPI